MKTQENENQKKTNIHNVKHDRSSNEFTNKLHIVEEEKKTHTQKNTKYKKQNKQRKKNQIV